MTSRGFAHFSWRERHLRSATRRVPVDRVDDAACGEGVPGVYMGGVYRGGYTSPVHLPSCLRHERFPQQTSGMKLSKEKRVNRSKNRGPNRSKTGIKTEYKTGYKTVIKPGNGVLHQVTGFTLF